MGLNHSPKATMNGLVLCLDMANKRSYPGSGIEWKSLVPLDLPANLVSSPVFTGNSISFNATSQVVQINNASILDMRQSEGLTLEAWIYPRTYGNGDFGRIFNKQTNNNGYAFFVDNGTTTNASSLRYGVNILTTANNESVTVLNVVGLNVWQHVAVSQSPSNVVVFYINGQNVGTRSVATFPNATPSFLRIGNRASLDRGFDGEISDVRIYNRVLQDSELRQNFNAFKGRYRL